MKKIACLLLCLVLVIIGALPVQATSGVPEDVLEAAKSVVRILSEYKYESATGSGFIISNEPGETLIVTNHHVVENNPYRISIWVGDEETVEADILFASAEKDLAVLTVAERVNLVPLKLAETQAKQGDAVYAVGYPGAADYISDTIAHTSESATITDGIISAVRMLTLEDHGEPVQLLQINADINSGNSGGPLFNAQGQVVGVNTYGVNNAQGVYGAVDVCEVKVLLDENGVILAEESPVPEKDTSGFPVVTVLGLLLSAVLFFGTLGFHMLRKKNNIVTLRSFMENNPQGIGIHKATAMLIPIAIQLRDMHNNGKTHLQISPDSITLTPSGVVLNESSSREEDRYSSGFAAPEIYQGMPCGIFSDIYSFAAVLYYVAFGKMPANALHREELEEDIALAETTDKSFTDILRKCMAWEPTERIKTMQELIFCISSFNTQVFKPVTPKAKKPVALVVAAVLSCVIATVSLIWYPVIQSGMAYKDAVLLMEEKQYEDAIAAFDRLDGYKDSEERIEVCKTAIQAEKYSRANKLMSQKDYKQAAELFYEIRDYLDSAKLRRECKEYQKIEDARANFEGYWDWIYPGWINPYDQYFIDFDTQTITFYFKSPTTEFTHTYSFTVDSDQQLTSTGFRDEGTVILHFMGDRIFLEYPVGSYAPSDDKENLYLVPDSPE